jgi:hypothetical protein
MLCILNSVNVFLYRHKDYIKQTIRSLKHIKLIVITLKDTCYTMLDKKCFIQHPWAILVLLQEEGMLRTVQHNFYIWERNSIPTGNWMHGLTAVISRLNDTCQSISVYETNYISHNVHIILFASETSLFMLNLIHVLSHCNLSYIAIECVNRFSFQHFKFFLLFFLILLNYV